MTKKFTKGCAVDLRGQSKLVKNTIFRTVGYDFSYMKDASYAYDYLINNAKEEVFIGNVRGNNTILTPTDILGPELVKAIEEGCTPWFEGDGLPTVENKVIYSNGSWVIDNPDNTIRWSSFKGVHPIAYKPIEPSIKPTDFGVIDDINATVLSEKVGPTSFLLLSEQSHNDLMNIKTSAESIKKSDCEIAKALMREVFKDLIDELEKKGENE